MAIVGVYNPPNSIGADGPQFFRQTLTSICDSGFKLIHVMGDFNLPKVDIQSDQPTSNQFSCELFYNIFLEFDLMYKVTFPIHSLSNSLDLILTTSPELINNVFAESDVYHSDHSSIIFSFACPTPKLYSPRLVNNYKSVDWMLLRDLIEFGFG